MEVAENTRNYYEVNASAYFASTLLQDLMPLWRRFLVTLRPGLNVLDMGCGSGRDVAYFAEHGLVSVGLDYSFSLLNLAKTVTQQPLVAGDFTNLPFRNASFDAVWSIGSLVHVPKAQLCCVLAEAARVLRPEGILMTSVKRGTGETVDRLGRFIAYYQSDEWQHSVETAGFEVIEISISEPMQEVAPNNTGQIDWIVCLARKVI